ncbi:hypothetical protein AMS68_007708 [Peltaster fructicola]|uniref:GATA-type domain-containing protein n=1 Tax=Peltaster fructicola TaxID=286661 RepID=A0A6H0Y5I7_9PEZI|nr:hypothetical protein AMS68_007708 [Peltaster fructicola]
MATSNGTRINAPQAFVSSFAPRIRTYVNSLLTPVQPQTVLPQIRMTKRGTTAINYSEEFDDDSIDDSDNPRRLTGLRTAQLRREADINGEKPGQKELGKEITSPVDMQGIWREWMGKPKRVLTERQLNAQSVLPTTLVPIRIDVDVAAFQPDAPLPLPQHSKDFGIDENLPAYRRPEGTPPYRLKDTFLWNLHEALITPDQFARVFVDELDFPLARKPAMVLEISQQIRQQLEEHAVVALHPLFQPSGPEKPAATAESAVRPAIASREMSSTPLRVEPTEDTLLQPPRMNGQATLDHSTPNGISTPAIAVTARPIQPEAVIPSVHNPADALRCILTLSINLQNQLYTDKFEWSLSHPPGFAEVFAKQTCADLGLSGEWVPVMTHAIYESSMRLKKDMVDNNGSLVGVVGSGVNGWGEVENEACEFHGTAESALGVGAGWRFDEDGLGGDWEPKIEFLSKEEIEKREGDRERQIRRQRRETARFTTTTQPHASSYNDYFSGGLGSQANGGGEDERMGRGERSKKKRRFRSLSPVGRETPEVAGFGGTSGTLTEGERQYWVCKHCHVWGPAVWGVRDGPEGPKTLCNNCGLLYERNKRLSPWTKELFKNEKNQATREAWQQASVQHPQQPPVLPRPTPQTFRSDVSSFAPVEPAPIHHIAPAPRPIVQQHQQHQDINPASHLYTGASAGGQGQISASTMADIVNYAEPGEDLDWTKITEPRERKRLQNIINGRKYRERRLAAEGHGGSGGNYPGAAGVGSFLSQGYGQRQSLQNKQAAAARSVEPGAS